MAIGAALGFAVARVAGASLNAESVWPALVTTVTGAIAAGLPDMLDMPNSAGRKALGASWGGIRQQIRRRGSPLGKVLLIPRAAGALVLDIFSGILPHRGPSHWLLTWALLSVLAYLGAEAWWHSSAVALAASVGYLSHLLADGLTTAGVPFLGPLMRRRLHLLPHWLRFTAESGVQWLFVALVSAGALWVWWWIPRCWN
jgi:inner membrane protein